MEKETTEVVETQTRAPIKASLISKGGLIPTNFEELYRLSHVMAASGMMPKGIETAAKVFVAVQNGLEVGLSPMQAVQNTAVINGRATIYGDAALGLIRASGLLEKFKEWFEGQGDNLTAHCHVKRKGEADSAIGTFSVADAKLAKLYPGDALSPWAKYPKRMLQWRARSWPLRDKFADVLRGLRITEEAIDLKEIENGSFSMAEPEILPKNFNNIAVPDQNGAVDPDAHEDFDKKRLPEPTDIKRLNEFLGLIQQSSEKTIYEIKQEAFDHWDEFWPSFVKWQGKKYGEDKPEPTDKDPIRGEYIKLKSKGFSIWVWKNRERIPTLAAPYQVEIREKWANLYPEDTYPLDKPEDATQGEIATPGGENEEQTEPRTPIGPDPGLTGVPPLSAEEEIMLSTIEGAKLDSVGRPCVPCPNRNGMAALIREKCNSTCEERVGCPTFEEYDKPTDNPDVMP